MIAAGSGLISRPQRSSSPPQVTSIRERMYRIQPGDSFETLSQHFYASGTYAQAVRKYIQNDPRSSQLVRQNGQLTPGEVIFVPSDASVLATRFADALPSTPPIPVATTPPASPAPPIGTSSPDGLLNRR